MLVVSACCVALIALLAVIAAVLLLVDHRLEVRRDAADRVDVEVLRAAIPAPREGDPVIEVETYRHHG